MRDLKSLPGPKRYVDTVEDAHAAVRAAYPGAMRTGSVGAWSWSADDVLVAEAWLHAARSGWWLRILPRPR